MKWKYPALVALLLAAAGLLGWLLPVLVTEQGDRSLEGRAEPVSIRQIDLSYRFDLSLADKLRLFRNPTEAAPLERGVFLTDREAKTILESFLEKVAGDSLSRNEDACSAAPELRSLGAEGSAIVWNVTADLNEHWRCEALLDDQSGLLLHCRFSGDAARWDSLIPGFDRKGDVRDVLCAVLEETFEAHYSRQLTAGVTVEAEAETGPLGIFGNLLLRTAEGENLRIPFRLILAMGRLEVNY